MAERKRAKRPKTREDTVAGVWRLLTALGKKAKDEDPWLTGDLLAMRDWLNAAIIESIISLRRRGCRWEDIAYDLRYADGRQMTTDAAIKRYAKYLPEDLQQDAEPQSEPAA